MTGITHVYQYLLFVQCFLKKSLIETSTSGLLNHIADILNLSLGSFVVRTINDVREDRAIVLSHLQISCTLGWGSRLPQAGDVRVGVSICLTSWPCRGDRPGFAGASCLALFMEGLEKRYSNLSASVLSLIDSTTTNWREKKKVLWWCWKKSNGLLIKILRGALSLHLGVVVFYNAIHKITWKFHNILRGIEEVFSLKNDI